MIQSEELLRSLKKYEHLITNEDWTTLNEILLHQVTKESLGEWCEFCNSSGIFYNPEIQQQLIDYPGLLMIKNKHLKLRFTIPIKSLRSSRFISWQLSQLVFEEPLEDIPCNAFEACEIDQVNIPDGCKKLCANSFYYSRIKRLYLPQSLTCIAVSAFDVHRIKNIYYSGVVEEFRSIDGVSAMEDRARRKYDLNINCTDGKLIIKGKI